MLMKKWDINNCKEVNKKFTRIERHRSIIFNWYLTNATLNKHVLVGIWDVIFYKTSWNAITFKKNRKTIKYCKQYGRNVLEILGFINLSKLT